ncbi:hypothetical protein AS156_16010 [Bradyrhizobium macuxiense]|uniref:Uncharacterized protein n=1 Tax=Bradyrhizobium macuxiense TaxID=1755647 RepID=A0A125Q6Z6_9BRAD|nr:hypothetical protein [Bradyrhizobium macuxiense]KWV49475.1 hypothetical protein AS156_16010 [Bradyrhizobium macuxiense]
MDEHRQERIEVIGPALWADDGAGNPVGGPSTSRSRLAELAEYLTFEQAEDDIKRCKTRLKHIDQPVLRRLVLGETPG